MKISESSDSSQNGQENVVNLDINVCRKCLVIVKLSMTPRERGSCPRFPRYYGPQNIFENLMLSTINQERLKIL